MELVEVVRRMPAARACRYASIGAALGLVAYIGVEIGRKLAASATDVVPEAASAAKTLAPSRAVAGPTRPVRLTAKVRPIPGKAGTYTSVRGEAIRFVLSTRNGYERVSSRLE
jgi:hypothetical protein